MLLICQHEDVHVNKNANGRSSKQVPRQEHGLILFRKLRQTDQPTNKPKDRKDHGEVSLPISRALRKHANKLHKHLFVSYVTYIHLSMKSINTSIVFVSIFLRFVSLPQFITHYIQAFRREAIFQERNQTLTGSERPIDVSNFH